MYFIGALIVLIAFFIVIVFKGFERRDKVLVAINSMAILSLLITLVLEVFAMSGKQEILTNGLVVFVVLVANSYLLLRSGTDFFEDYLDDDIRLNQNRRDAQFILSTRQFYHELLQIDKRRQWADAINLWNDSLESIVEEQYEQAYKQLSRLHARFPTVSTTINLAGIFLEMGKPKQALRVLDSIGSEDVLPWQAHSNRGMALVKTGNYTAAFHAFSTISLDEITSWTVAMNFARVCRKLQKDQQASELFMLGTRLAPKNYKAWYYLALSLTRLGEHEKALNSFEHALRLEKNDASLWYNRGNALVRLGEYLRAIKSYDKAIALNPGYVMAWNNKGIALTRLGQISRAVHCYKRALSFDSRYCEAILNCGLAYDSQGSSEKALEYYSRFLQIAPSDLDEHMQVVKTRISELAKSWKKKQAQSARELPA